jgi:hypothetical protein
MDIVRVRAETVLQGEPRKEQRTRLECNSGIKGRDVSQQDGKGRRVSNRKARSQVCEWAVGNEWLDTVKGSATA